MSIRGLSLVVAFLMVVLAPGVSSVAFAGSEPQSKEASGEVKRDPNTGELHIEFTGFRNSKGIVRIALFLNKRGFPEKDEVAYRKVWAPIVNKKAKMVLKGIPAGDFAIAGLHDEDKDDEMETFLGIPREGFCISRNPRVKLRAPRFHEVKMDLKKGTKKKVHLKIKYL